jgi:hypothetical protein
MLDPETKTSDFERAKSDPLPALCRQQSIEAPQLPCAMPGGEAEMLSEECSSGGATLCQRCNSLGPIQDLQTKTEVTRWLRAAGFSRSIANRMGRAWSRESEVEGSDTETPSPITASIKAMIAAISQKDD